MRGGKVTVGATGENARIQVDLILDDPTLFAAALPCGLQCLAWTRQEFFERLGEAAEEESEEVPPAVEPQQPKPRRRR